MRLKLLPSKLEAIQNVFLDASLLQSEVIEMLISLRSIEHYCAVARADADLIEYEKTALEKMKSFPVLGLDKFNERLKSAVTRWENLQKSQAEALHELQEKSDTLCAKQAELLQLCVDSLDSGCIYNAVEGYLKKTGLGKKHSFESYMKSVLSKNMKIFFTSCEIEVLFNSDITELLSLDGLYI